MFSQENGRWQGPYYYDDPEQQGTTCYGMAWSENGDQLAVFSRLSPYDPNEKLSVLIINKYADPQKLDHELR